MWFVCGDLCVVCMVVCMGPQEMERLQGTLAQLKEQVTHTTSKPPHTQFNQQTTPVQSKIHELHDPFTPNSQTQPDSLKRTWADHTYPSPLPFPLSPFPFPFPFSLSLLPSAFPACGLTRSYLYSMYLGAEGRGCGSSAQECPGREGQSPGRPLCRQ